MYTINKESEEPPNINNLFSLKVKVPKVKVSKYFQDKYNNGNQQRNVLKLNDSQFLSNNSTYEEQNQNNLDYEYE